MLKGIQYLYMYMYMYTSGDLHNSCHKCIYTSYIHPNSRSSKAVKVWENENQDEATVM